MAGAQWTIKARVTNKAPKRSFSRDGASKSVFSIEVVDEQVPLLPATAAAATAAAAAAVPAHLSMTTAPGSSWLAELVEQSVPC